MRTLNPVRHDEKRQEILAAAARCITRDGFRGASTADICAEAGISPGHLYHYFPSKEAILTDLAAAGLEKVAARFTAIMQGDDPLGTLIGEIGRHKNSKKDPQARARSRLIVEMLAEAGRNPVIARIMQRNSAGLLTVLGDFIKNGQARGQIDPGLDSAAAARMLMAVMDGMRSMGIRDPDADSGAGIEMLQILLARFLSPPVKR